jgi:hypothetical protein
MQAITTLRFINRPSPGELDPETIERVTASVEAQLKRMQKRRRTDDK